MLRRCPSTNQHRGRKLTKVLLIINQKCGIGSLTSHQQLESELEDDVPQIRPAELDRLFCRHVSEVVQQWA